MGDGARHRRRQVKDARLKDPSLLLFFEGRSESKAFYDEAFVKATGATWLQHGGLCSDALNRASEYTLGLSGGLHPDFLAARAKGMKTVVIDPRLRGGGPFADEWLPIRAGTDLALALALCSLLVASGHVDRPYLTSHTNAPFLVGDDGRFVRQGGKELVWDAAEQKAKPVSAAAEPALEGEYDVGGGKAKPVVQLFKEHVAPCTPTWVAEICGISTDQIVRVGTELAEHAMIGSTTTVDGVNLPYRPVGAMAYHVSQQELGFQAFRRLHHGRCSGGFESSSSTTRPWSRSPRSSAISARTAEAPRSSDRAPPTPGERSPELPRSAAAETLRAATPDPALPIRKVAA